MNPTDEPMTTVALNGGTEVSAEVLSTLAEIGEEVNASLDPDEVLARSAALIKRHIDYEIFGVLMIEGEGSYLRSEERRVGKEWRCGWWARVLKYKVMSVW